MKPELKKETVVALVGPTASGKTALALKIAQAVPLEVIACDSRTVYRHMDIGTAKPTAEECAIARHHMLDLVNPDGKYTVSKYRQEASGVMDGVMRRGLLPVVCGGTGFYARALLEGLEMPDVAPQAELREQLHGLAESKGNEALWEKLHEVDPKAAEKLNANDRFRVVRALEVFKVLGKPFSEAASRVDPPYDTIWIGLNANDRAFLYKRITDRFAEQVTQGMVEEVEDLHKKWGDARALTSTVNYQEIMLYLKGELSKEDALEQALRHNCQLARKQLIWFRSNEKIKWFPIDEDVDQMTQNVINYVKARL
ncbi:MAG: tRNA (adenosine(37)-N6)-dimethylallyltransferase MiaA [Candidatus Obscuribacterales bacterium]|nr:tRNA (adenosine(37)-N6)-dimethylallyltransferase MiaA [Candidatus Obscuribacterales bacterium]